MLEDLRLEKGFAEHRKAGVLPYVALAAGIAVMLAANQLFKLA
jgi:hypothetical protein